MGTSIGIVGAGVSGLHLGLFLRARDVPVTIYADKEPDAIRAGKLLNTVAHHHHTLERKRALGATTGTSTSMATSATTIASPARCASAATSSIRRRPSTTASTCRA